MQVLNARRVTQIDCLLKVKSLKQNLTLFTKRKGEKKNETS